MLNNENKSDFLTKDEELELGKTIQEYYRLVNDLDDLKISVSDNQVVDNNNLLTIEQIENYNNILLNGTKSIEKMVNSNIRLVHDRARVYKAKTNTPMEYDDLVQEGMAGLMIAIQKYDPTLNNKFSTIAYYWISQSIARGANKTSRLVRLPENRINDVTRINTLTQKISLNDNSEYIDTDSEIVDKLNLSKKDLLNIRSAAYNHTSLNKVVGTDGDSGKELIDFVSEENCSDAAEDLVINSELNSILYEAVDSLSPIERDIIVSYFSLSDAGSTGITPKEIKEKYGLQQHKFKKIQTDAMKQLKNILSFKGLNFSDFC